MKENKANPERKMEGLPERMEELADDALDQVAGGAYVSAVSDPSNPSTTSYNSKTAMPNGFDKAFKWIDEREDTDFGR